MQKIVRFEAAGPKGEALWKPITNTACYDARWFRVVFENVFCNTLEGFHSLETRKECGLLWRASILSTGATGYTDNIFQFQKDVRAL